MWWELFVYSSHTDISSVDDDDDDDYVLEAMETENSVYQKIRLLVSQF